jgi:uncharacterized protein YaiE (UPF0345 family)
MSNQLVITSGAKVRSLEGVITGSTGVLNSLPINGANGIPQLDSSGKILVSQLPNSVMEYKGTWNANTNTPTLADGTGNQGDVYLCNVAGTTNFGSGPIAFVVGDQVIYSGTIWQRASGATGTVTSVAVTESGDALSITGSPITTSGTINIGFAGSSAQYVAGDGSLVTFPTIITEAQNLITDVYNETGATLTKGTVVYINGGHGNLPTVTKAIATSDATSAQTYGIVQANITNNNNGHVVVIGSLGDLDTQAYAAGTQLYLSSTTAGAWTSVKQYAPAHLVYVAIVVRSHPTQGIVEVRIQNGFELDELHNVSAQSPSNNEGIFYNTSTSLWENKSIATALGYTPISLTSLSATTPLSYNNTTGAFSISQATTSTNGYLSSTDWNTFNSKGSGSVTSVALSAPTGFSVTGSPITTTGTLALAFATGYSLPTNASQTNWDTAYSLRITSATSPLSITSNVISISQASGSTNGYLSSTDWTTFNSKQGAITLTTTGTSGAATLVGSTLNIPQYQAAGTYVTSVTGTSPIISSGGITPAISITQATTSTSGYLSSTDWNTFNGKQNALTNPVTGTGTSGQVTYFNGTSSVTGSNNLKFDGTNLSIGNPSSPLAQLHVYNASAAATILLQTNSTTDYSEIAVRNDSSTATSYFRQYSTAATGSDFGISRAGLALFFSNYATNFAIGTRNGGSLIFGTADTERMRINTSGNVGIGVTTGSGKLFVKQSGTGFETGINSYCSANDSFISMAHTGSVGIISTSYNSTGSYLPLTFATSDTERMRITSAGLVGIGTTSPSYKLDTYGTSGTTSLRVRDGNLTATAQILLECANTFSGTSQAFISGVGANGGNNSIDLLFGTASGSSSAAERMRISSAGNVGIGTSSPAQTLDVNGTIQISGSGNWIKYDTATAFFGSASTISGGAASQLGIRSGSDILFAAGGATERMRITSAGNIEVKTSGAYISFFGTTQNTALQSLNDTTLRIRTLLSGNGALSIESLGTGLVYSNSGLLTSTNPSDKRLKDNITNLSYGLNEILQLRPVSYHWKDDKINQGIQFGFIAQEVQEIMPEAVKEFGDEIKYLGLEKDAIYAALVKSVQELKAEIDELKNK